MKKIKLFKIIAFIIFMLDAIKEAYAQDKKLLYTALKKINKTWDYKNESAVEYTDDIPFIL